MAPLLLMVATAWAGALEVGVAAGVTDLPAAHELYRSPGPQEPIGAVPSGLLRLGVYPFADLGVAVEASLGGRGQALLYRVGGLVEAGFPIVSLPLDVAPFGLVGLGAIGVAGSSPNGADVDYDPQWGAGVRLSPARDWRLRVEYRGHVLAALGLGRVTASTAWVGVSWRPGPVTRVEKTAVRTLEQLSAWDGPPDAAELASAGPGLERALGLLSRDPRVPPSRRGLAVSASGSMTDPADRDRARKRLMRILGRSRGASAKLRGAATGAIAALDGAAAVPVLVPLLDDPDPDTRVAAMHALEGLGQTEALGDLPRLEVLVAGVDGPARRARVVAVGPDGRVVTGIGGIDVRDPSLVAGEWTLTARQGVCRAVTKVATLGQPVTLELADVWTIPVRVELSAAGGGPLDGEVDIVGPPGCAPNSVKIVGGEASFLVGSAALDFRVRSPGRVTTVTRIEAGSPSIAVVAALEATELAVVGDRILAPAITFGPGAAEIDPGSLAALDALASTLVAADVSLVAIEAHTDDQVDAAVGLTLSQARADAVKAALIARGVLAERVRATGFGGARPVADNLTDAGRAQNRRIDFIVVTP